MIRKSIVLGLLFLFSTLNAQADNFTLDITDITSTITFGVTHTDNDPFIDVFNFTGFTEPVIASASLVSIGFIPAQDIEFSSVTLNGNPLTYGNGFFSYAYTPSQLSLTGPLQLVVQGTSGATRSIFASYSGTLNVTAVPEPGIYSMLLAGLSMVGFMIRRRKVS